MQNHDNKKYPVDMTDRLETMIALYLFYEDNVVPTIVSESFPTLRFLHFLLNCFDYLLFIGKEVKPFFAVSLWLSYFFNRTSVTTCNLVVA